MQLGGGRGYRPVPHLGGSSTVTDSIVAGNIGFSGADVDGDFSSEGYNLIGNGDHGTGFIAIGDQVGSGASPIDAKLGPLQDNGGETDTMELLEGSPARDHGNLGGATDQRGQPRPFDDPSIPNADGGNGSDIGAFEVETAVSTPTPTQTSTATITLTPTLTPLATQTAVATATTVEMATATVSPTSTPVATPTPSPTAEATTTVSVTPTPSPTPTPTPRLGDANCDGSVGAADLPTLLLELSSIETSACGLDDVSGDSHVDSADIDPLVEAIFRQP